MSIPSIKNEADCLQRYHAYMNTYPENYERACTILSTLGVLVNANVRLSMNVQKKQVTIDTSSFLGKKISSIANTILQRSTWSSDIQALSIIITDLSIFLDPVYLPFLPDADIMFFIRKIKEAILGIEKLYTRSSQKDALSKVKLQLLGIQDSLYVQCKENGENISDYWQACIDNEELKRCFETLFTRTHQQYQDEIEVLLKINQQNEISLQICELYCQEIDSLNQEIPALQQSLTEQSSTQDAFSELTKTLEYKKKLRKETKEKLENMQKELQEAESTMKSLLQIHEKCFTDVPQAVRFLEKQSRIQLLVNRRKEQITQEMQGQNSSFSLQCVLPQQKKAENVRMLQIWKKIQRQQQQKELQEIQQNQQQQSAIKEWQQKILEEGFTLL